MHWFICGWSKMESETLIIQATAEKVQLAGHLKKCVLVPALQNLPVTVLNPLPLTRPKFPSEKMMTKEHYVTTEVYFSSDSYVFCM